MSLDEAANILNVDKNSLTDETIIEKYEKMFQNNEVSNGGSFYLQSKIVRARERIDLELMDRNKDVPKDKESAPL